MAQDPRHAAAGADADRGAADGNDHRLTTPSERTLSGYH